MVRPVTLEAALATRSAVIVPDVIDAAAAADARARLIRAGYQRYVLVDRGRYSFAIDLNVAELIATLAPLVAATTGRTRALVDARVLKLEPGDYVLARHDRVMEQGIEVVLDLSLAPMPGAEVHYRQHGQVMFRVPSAPGSAAIVPRAASVTCNHTYISKLHRDAEVVRLVARYA
jgi:hypothetical protein